MGVTGQGKGIVSCIAAIQCTEAEATVNGVQTNANNL